MVEPLSLISRVFTAKISCVPKFRNFTVNHCVSVYEYKNSTSNSDKRKVYRNLVTHLA